MCFKSFHLAFVVFVELPDVRTESSFPCIMCSCLGGNVTTVEALDWPVRHLINKLIATGQKKIPL